MSTCLPGNPRIYISQPHFKGSPDELREAIEGMPPAMDDDLSVFNIEPITGVIVEVQQRQRFVLVFYFDLCYN
jgi:hypothetical protein